MNNRKIVIVFSARTGMHTGINVNAYFNPFKKSRSNVLKENLEKKLKENGLYYEVSVDVNHGDLQYLKREGYQLMLISPYISQYQDYDGIECTDYYKMSLDEFDNGNVDNIIAYLLKMEP